MKSDKREKFSTVINKLICDSVKKRATDIHFNCFESDAKIRIRVDGVLQTVGTIAKKEYLEICDALKEMSGLSLDEKRLPQDGRCLLSIEKKPVDLRVSVMPCVFGENICLRILSKEALCLDIGKAGFSEHQLGTVRKWCGKPNGIVLVTGPAGSGKTTVEYMILNELNKESSNVFSVEDPVEYTIPGVNQVQINPRAGLTFSSTIRAILRQDPDVVMVGEIRDFETVQIMVETAITGHLVLSTLHTNTATEAVLRLKDLGLEPFLIKDAVTGIINQRLVRILCKECREKYVPDDITLQHFKLKKQEYYKAAGCKSCNNTGYRGRCGIYELYEPGHTTMNMLLKGCSDEELRGHALGEGMIGLFQDGVSKAEQGITSLEEVIRAASGVI